MGKRGRKHIVDLYRTTGLRVLELMVHEDQQAADSMLEATKELDVPPEIAGIISEFTVRKEFVDYLESTKASAAAAKHKLTMNLTPCQLLQMYTSPLTVESVQAKEVSL